MPNRCVAAVCGNMPSDSVCAMFGPDKLSERGWIGSLARRVNCLDEIPALEQFTGSIYALLYNVTVS